MACFNPLAGISKIYYAIYTDEIEYYYNSFEEIVISGDTIFTEIDFESARVTQKLKQDQKGDSYEKEFEIEIKDFHKALPHTLNNKKIAVLFDDVNKQRFVTGHETPFSIDKIDSSNENSENRIRFSLTQSSYDQIQPCQISNCIFISGGSYVDLSTSPQFDVNSTEFNMLSGNEMTFSFNVKFNNVTTNTVLWGKDLQYRFRIESGVLYFETYGTTDVWDECHTTVHPVVADVWYKVVAYISRPQIGMYINRFDTFDSENCTNVSTAGFNLDANENQFFINGSNEFKNVGLWSRWVDFSGISFLATTEYLSYAELDPSLINRIVAYYNIPSMSGDTIEDSHIHNLDLTSDDCIVVRIIQDSDLCGDDHTYEAINIGDGVGIYAGETSDGIASIFTFKTLHAGDNIALTPSASGVTISMTGSTGGGSVYTGATPSTISLGGITAGYQLTGRTYSQLFEKLLVVYQSPAFTAFNITSQSTLLEVGDSLSGSKTFTWTTSNSGNVQANSIVIRDVTGAVDLATGLANDGTESVSIGTITNTSPISQSWRAQGTNTNSIGFNSSNFTVTSIYPYFYGKVSSGGALPGDNRPTADVDLVTGGTKVLASSTGTITISFGSTSDDYSWFAIPSTSTSKTKWYVDALNNGTIGGSVSSGGNLFPAFDTVSVTTVKWSGVDYKVYITNYQTAIAGSMEMRNS